MAIQHRYPQYAPREQPLRETARVRVEEAYQGTEEMVRRHPASSAAVTFAVGFGAGLLLTMMMSPPARRQSHWYDSSNLPEWVSRRQLTDALSKLLPDSLARRIS